jgi:PncC family amidohydrolase
MAAIPLEQLVRERLLELNLTLAVAESCTGGLLSHLITNVPGSSAYFLGGAITYANQIKMNILGVKQTTLDKFGAVSRETVLEMAQGVKMLMQADIGLSTSGIAGPGGGTPEKPVGLTWIGISGHDTNLAHRFLWKGDRLAVKEQTAHQALQILLKTLDTYTA